MRVGSPYRQQVMHGTPIRALGRTLVPVARVVSLSRHRVTIRRREIEGTSSGFAHVRPLHVIEVGPDGNRLLPVRDVTAHVIGQMALVAAAIVLVSLALIAANHRAGVHR